MRPRSHVQPPESEKTWTHVKRLAGSHPSITFDSTQLADALILDRPLSRTGRRSARMSIQGSGEHPASPAQWLYGLLRALPGEPCTVATVDANFGASGPHVFAVRCRAVRFRHYRR